MPEIRHRARDLGITIGTLPSGPLGAITDVPGVRVGHCTVSWGGPDLAPGDGPARTGVTAVIPHDGSLFDERLVAGVFAANGVGEVIGSTCVEEWGVIESPLVLTNTHALGVACDATVRWMIGRDPVIGLDDTVIPIVAECDDGLLNDARGVHVLPEHVHAALDAAATGPVAGGSVGAGTGMSCHDFKGGIGHASRIVEAGASAHTVGVLVLTNFGTRERLTIDGVPVGREITDLMPVENRPGSCIVVLATDAPLTARQCRRVALRCALGLALSGSYAADGSGEIMLAFSTAQRLPRESGATLRLESVANDYMSEFFEAAVDATAEAVIDSLCSATTVVGRNGNVVHALPLDRLVDVMSRYGRSVRLPGA